MQLYDECEVLRFSFSQMDELKHTYFPRHGSSASAGISTHLYLPAPLGPLESSVAGTVETHRQPKLHSEYPAGHLLRQRSRLAVVTYLGRRYTTFSTPEERFVQNLTRKRVK